MNTPTQQSKLLEASARVCPEEANTQKKTLVTADLVRDSRFIKQSADGGNQEGHQSEFRRWKRRPIEGVQHAGKPPGNDGLSGTDPSDGRTAGAE